MSSSTAGDGSGGGGGNKDGSDLATRVQQLEDRWQQLNSLPTNSDMFRRLHQFEQIQQGVEVADVEAAEPERMKTDGSFESGMTSSLTPLCRPRQPMVELWHAIQLLNKVENNTDGITRVRPWSCSYCGYSAADCSISLKFGTEFHCLTGDTLQMFKVKGQGQR